MAFVNYSVNAGGGKVVPKQAKKILDVAAVLESEHAKVEPEDVLAAECPRGGGRSKDVGPVDINYLERLSNLITKESPGPETISQIAAIIETIRGNEQLEAEIKRLNADRIASKKLIEAKSAQLKIKDIELKSLIMLRSEQYEAYQKKEPYPNLSLFVADSLIWNPKGDRHTMEYPFFSLFKRKDITPRHYESPDGKSTLTVTPTLLGLPTIWDKDLLIYTSTLIREAMNRGDMGETNQSIKIDVWNYLEATVKGDGAAQYKGVLGTLKRLNGCAIETTIETNGTSYTEGFHLLDGYRIATKTKTGKIASLEIKVCDWLYGAIWNATQEMLSISREYFKLEGGIERRLYELARKHCGSQPFWKVGMATLWEKSGSRGELKEFRRMVFKSQADLGNIPDYRVELRPEDDQVVFYTKHYKAPVEALLYVTRRKRKPVD